MERFAIFSEQGAPLGLMPRAEVHQQGLWHKSAQVFLFNGACELLVQQRSADKDLYASLWDYSVGEHLLPEEEFIEGAIRGLAEELGVTDVDLTPMGAVRWVRQQGVGFKDFEIQQAYQCTYDGEIVVEPEEVSAIRFVGLDELEAWIKAHAEEFTPWLLEDIALFRAYFPINR